MTAVKSVDMVHHFPLIACCKSALVSDGIAKHSPESCDGNVAESAATKHKYGNIARTLL